MHGSRPTLVFSSGRTWFQRLVQSVSLSAVDHVAIGLGSQLLHATEAGVVIEPRADWFGRDGQRFVAEYEILPDVSRNVLGCLDRVGEPYDRVGVVRTGLGIALRRAGSTLRPWPLWFTSGHTCASFAMLVDPHQDLIPEWRMVDPHCVVPFDLFQRVGSSFRGIVQPVSQL